MYPYTNWLKWIIKPRQKHLVDALERRPEAFRGKQGEVLQERLNGIDAMLKVRATLLVLLSFSLVAAIALWVVDFLGGFPTLAALIREVRNWTTGTAGVLSALYFFTLRTLRQLEIDALLLLPSHRSHWEALQGEGSRTTEDRRKEREREAQARHKARAAKKAGATFRS
ncbi:MAG: hypothetical protein KY455_10465 [Euryarchaeota archaeon]|nr:hypothetical protein [Euryarchaeota archaeon]